MGDPLTILHALVGAAIYAAAGILTRDKSKSEDAFNPDRLIPTFGATLVAGAILFAMGQEVNASNVTTFYMGNLGLAAAADKAYKFLKARFAR